MPGSNELTLVRQNTQLYKQYVNGDYDPTDFKAEIKKQLCEISSQIEQYSGDGENPDIVVYYQLQKIYIEMVKLYKIIEKDDEDGQKFVINFNIKVKDEN